MITASNLQCPHCSSPIHLPQATLAESNAAIICAHCQRKSIVDAPALFCNDPISNPISASDTYNETHTADKAVISTGSALYSDMLIHDDMEIDDAIDLNTIAEYDSLEGMNAWVTKLDTTPSTPINVPGDNNTNNDYSSNGHETDHYKNSSQKTNNYEADTKIVADSLDKSDNHSISFNNDIISGQYNDTAISSTAISSADANDIRASIATDTSDPIHENAWLETLLQEQKATEYPAINDHENIELAQQLTDMGVPTINTQANNQALANKIQTRIQASGVTSAHHNAPAISTLLWAVGSGLLILLLLTQYMIFNINNLAKNPALASRLQTVCSVLPCTIPPADINAFIITKPTIKTSQVKNARNFSDIQAQLVNGDIQTQLLPNLKVSIYTQDTIIGEFIAQPSDYLLSSETKLAAERHKSVMFTVPITAKKISKVMIEPFY